MTEKLERRAPTDLGATPGELSWERPQRPPDPAAPRWLRFAPIAALAVIGGGAYLAFAPQAVDDGSPPASARSTPGATTTRDPSAGSGDGFELLSATWGPVDPDDTAGSAPVATPALTERQQHEHAFHEAARERWKGTEIFVRGGPR